MRNKTITLCPTSYELAQKMPNFSGWVRAKLIQTTYESESVRPRREKCMNCGCIDAEIMYACTGQCFCHDSIGASELRGNSDDK